MIIYINPIIIIITINNYNSGLLLASENRAINFTKTIQGRIHAVSKRIQTKLDKTIHNYLSAQDTKLN